MNWCCHPFLESPCFLDLPPKTLPWLETAIHISPPSKHDTPSPHYTLSQPGSQRGRRSKEKIILKIKEGEWSCHCSLLWKTIGKKPKIRLLSGKPDLGSESRLRVRKVLAPPQRPS